MEAENQAATNGSLRSKILRAARASNGTPNQPDVSTPPTADASETPMSAPATTTASVPAANGTAETAEAAQAPAPAPATQGGDQGAGNGEVPKRKISKWAVYKNHLNATKLEKQEKVATALGATISTEATTNGGGMKRNISANALQKVLFAQQAVDYMSKRRKSQAANDEFIRRFNMRRGSVITPESENSANQPAPQKLSFDRGDLQQLIFHPNEPVIFAWLTVVSAACLYNLWSVIPRLAFKELNELYSNDWLFYDILSDLIYFCDIFVQFRTGFLKKGMMVYDVKEMANRYLHSTTFILDVVSLAQPTLLLPNSILSLFGPYAGALRCVRFIKVFRALKWSEMIQNTTGFPNTWRVMSLTHFLLLSCHWFAAIYYMLSEYEEFATQWTYPQPEGEYATLARKYLVCFCWAALTLTNVGADKTPETNLELTFTILCFLLGLYVFAAIVGQVSNVVMEQNAHRMEFEKMLDTAKGYMLTHNVPADLQTRVIRWYEFMWLKGGIEATQDVNALQLLPEKLKAEISIFVHAKALQKVTIFQKCRPEFLYSLVLKMTILICTPGDYICRKDELAKEMFLVIEGIVEIVSDTGQVLKQMEAGDFFGEIGVLNYGGVNRRTADVRSLGYARLFVLSRDDVLEALKDDVEADTVLRDYAKERLAALHQMQKTTPPPTSTPTPMPTPVPSGQSSTSEQRATDANSGSDKKSSGDTKPSEKPAPAPVPLIMVTASTTADAKENAPITTNRPSANGNDLFDLFAQEMKVNFAQTIDKITSTYRKKVGTMEDKIRELEKEVQRLQAQQQQQQQQPTKPCAADGRRSMMPTVAYTNGNGNHVNGEKQAGEPIGSGRVEMRNGSRAMRTGSVGAPSTPMKIINKCGSDTSKVKMTLIRNIRKTDTLIISPEGGEVSTN